MDILVNGQDEPRVVFNTEDADALLGATKIKDAEPFRISPVYTSEFFRERSGCTFVASNRGFPSSLEDVGCVLRSNIIRDSN